MVCAELGTRGGERGDDGNEYPRTPDDVNGLHCAFGSLGLFSFVIGDDGAKRPMIERPSYHRLAYVDAYKLDKCARTLAKIERRTAKMRETRGYPTTWGEDVLRFAEATGATWIAFDEKTIRHVDSDRNLHGARWAFYAPGEARWLLERLADSWMVKVKETRETEAAAS
jgi:hypothetical protein